MRRISQIMTPNSYLPILLLAILVDEVCNNHLIGTFSGRPPLQQAIFYIVFLIFQILASPLQAGFSDFYCRKKSLIASLSFSVLSLIFSLFYLTPGFSQILMLSLAVLVKSCLGNTLPLAWAGIADTNNRNYRLSLGLSTSTIAIGYLTLIGIDNIFEKKESILVILFLYVCAIPLFITKFVDLVDRSEVRAIVLARSNFRERRVGMRRFFHLVFLECRSIKHRFLNYKRFRLGLFGTFLPVEISFYSTHALGVDFAIKKFEIITISMILGYISGVLTLKFFEKETDRIIMKFGYFISIISFFLIFLSLFLMPDEYLRWALVFCYFMYSFGVAFIVPSLFSILSKERELHEQGKIYGLIDSTDAIALLIALIFGMLYSLSNVIVVNVFSFICFLISRFFYGQFNKTKREF